MLNNLVAVSDLLYYGFYYNSFWLDMQAVDFTWVVVVINRNIYRENLKTVLFFKFYLR